MRIRDTICQNRIQHRELLFRNNRPTEINHTTTIINPPRNIFYIGGSIGAAHGNFEVTGDILLKTKSDYIYGLYYNPITNIKGGRVYIPLRFKKWQHN